jgi:hypothetical protein
MLFSPWRSLLTPRRRRAAARHPRSRLRLETLEDRCLLAGTVTITSVQGPGSSPTATPVAIATEGQSGPSLSATFTDTNALAPNLLRVTVNYGDGTAVSSNQPGANFDPNLVIMRTGTSYTVTDMHTFPEESGSTVPPFSFTVTMTVTEIATPANTDTKTGQAFVLDAPLAPGDPVPVGPGAVTVGGNTGNLTTAAAALANFKAAIGGVNNTAAAPQNGGFRTITWDGVKTDGTDAVAGPNSTVPIPPVGGGATKTVGIPLDRFQGSGVFFGAVYAVSSDGFVDVNPSVGAPNPVLFPAFSAPNTFAMFNDNGIDFKFVAPSATNTALVSAASRGFGSIFLNVQQPGTTIQFFHNATLIDTLNVPTGGPGAAVFAGELFSSPIVTNVLLTLGNGVIFKFDGTTVTSGQPNSASNNLVVVDDWAFAEPVPITNGFAITSGAAGTNNAAVLVNARQNQPFTGVVATFSDADPNGNAKDYTAIINWGDGHLTNGTIAADGKGGFSVTGTNTYVHGGSFPISVDVFDFGGGPGLAGSQPSLSITNTAKVTKNSDVGVLQTTVSNTVFTLDGDGFQPAPSFSSQFIYGAPGDVPITGDWTGNGITDIGVYRPSTGQFVLNTSGTGTFGPGDQVFQYGGLAGDIPVAGHWNGPGRDLIGIYHSSTGQFVLNTTGTGSFNAGDLAFTFGAPGGVPVIGDWAGTGTSQVGVYFPATGTFLLDAGGKHAIDPTNQTFTYGGLAGDQPVVGDWTGGGKTLIGVYHMNGQFVLNTTGTGTFTPGDAAFFLGQPGSKPVSGVWAFNGQPQFAAAPASGPIQGDVLTPETALDPIRAQAIALWVAAGISAAELLALQKATIQVGPLTGGEIGSTTGNVITLDPTAAGYGWDLDPNVADAPAAGQMDLLTVMAHEMGHVIGLSDDGSADGLMAWTLPAGVRRVPTPGDVAASAAAFSGA